MRNSKGSCSARCSRVAMSSAAIDGMHVEHQHGELIAAPARQHAFERRSGLLEAARGLHHELVAGSVAERVVDELEAIDVDEHDRDAPATPRAHVAQRAIELIHEVAAIRQAGECVVIARMLEALLQILALLDLGHELAIGDLQLASAKARAHRVRDAGCAPGRESRKPAATRRTPAMRWPRRAHAPDTSRSWGGWRAAGSRWADPARIRRERECGSTTPSSSGSIRVLTKTRGRPPAASIFDSSKSYSGSIRRLNCRLESS